MQKTPLPVTNPRILSNRNHEISSVRTKMTLVGANRGGTTITDAFLQKLMLQSLTPHRFDVQIVDQHLPRAQALARTWRQAGHDSIASGIDGYELTLKSTSTLLAAASDDAVLQLQYIQNKHVLLKLAGLVGAASVASDNSGYVLAFGAVVPQYDDETQRNAETLFGALAALSGGKRVTSRVLRAPILNDVQLSTVRTMLYHRLAFDTMQFLQAGTQKGELYVASLWPRQGIFPVRIQARNGYSRDEMRESAVQSQQTHVPLRRTGTSTFQPHARTGSRLGSQEPITIFFDKAKPDWLYLVWPNPTSLQRRPFAIELPTPSNPDLDREIEQQTQSEQLRRTQMASQSSVTFTD